MAGFRDVLKNITDSYREGAKQTNALPGELAAKRGMMEQADLALHQPVGPQQSMAPVAPIAPAQPFRHDLINPAGAPYGSRPGEKRLDVSQWLKR